ncbi:MAG: hypothetical protein KIS62_18565 [Ramlibacter sp.]|nr:hypothetical protein [Ramlibacter sp.]
MCWKLVVWAITMMGALFVGTTGLFYFDKVVGGLASLAALLVIESQRNFGKWSPRFRKIVLRAAINLPAIAGALLGLLFFVGFFYSLIASVSRDLPAASSSNLAIVLVTVFGGVGYAIFKTYRDLQMEEISFSLPRIELRKLLVDRPFVAKSPYEFVFFELMVAAVAWLFSGFAAAIVVGVLGV